MQSSEYGDVVKRKPTPDHKINGSSKTITKSGSEINDPTDSFTENADHSMISQSVYSTESSFEAGLSVDSASEPEGFPGVSPAITESTDPTDDYLSSRHAVYPQARPMEKKLSASTVVTTSFEQGTAGEKAPESLVRGFILGSIETSKRDLSDSVGFDSTVEQPPATVGSKEVIFRGIGMSKQPLSNDTLFDMLNEDEVSKDYRSNDRMDRLIFQGIEASKQYMSDNVDDPTPVHVHHDSLQLQDDRMRELILDGIEAAKHRSSSSAGSNAVVQVEGMSVTPPVADMKELILEGIQISKQYMLDNVVDSTSVHVHQDSSQLQDDRMRELILDGIEAAKHHLSTSAGSNAVVQVEGMSVTPPVADMKELILEGIQISKQYMSDNVDDPTSVHVHHDSSQLQDDRMRELILDGIEAAKHHLSTIDTYSQSFDSNLTNASLFHTLPEPDYSEARHRYRSIDGGNTRDSSEFPSPNSGSNLYSTPATFRSLQLPTDVVSTPLADFITHTQSADNTLSKPGQHSNHGLLTPPSCPDGHTPHNLHTATTMGSPDSAFRKWNAPIKVLEPVVSTPIESTNDAFFQIEKELEIVDFPKYSSVLNPPPEPPIDLSRYSPAHVVAATGGAPAEILREIKSTEPERPPTLETPIEFIDGGALPPLLDVNFSATTDFCPASPDDVEASSCLILGSFIVESYRRETRLPSSSQVNEDDASIFGSEFAHIPRAAPDSLEAMVARRLAQCGDEINNVYGPRLDRMISYLPSDKCPLQAFCDVARVLFSWGPTNWGQVVALFCFGYRLVIRRLSSSVLDAFRQVCNCLISFCRQVNLFLWIAAQGGWQIVQYLTLGVGRSNPREGAIVTSAQSSQAFLPSWSKPFLLGLATLCTLLFVYRRFAR